MRAAAAALVAVIAGIMLYAGLAWLAGPLGVLVHAISGSTSSVFLVRMGAVSVAGFASLSVALTVVKAARPMLPAAALGVLGLIAVVLPVVLNQGRAGIELFMHLIDLMMWGFGVAAAAFLASVRERGADRLDVRR